MNKDMRVCGTTLPFKIRQTLKDESIEILLMKYLAKKSENLTNGKWYRFSCDFSANTDINEMMVACGELI